jgi:hypothetical protein
LKTEDSLAGLSLEQQNKSEADKFPQRNYGGKKGTRGKKSL